MQKKICRAQVILYTADLSSVFPLRNFYQLLLCPVPPAGDQSDHKSDGRRNDPSKSQLRQRDHITQQICHRRCMQRVLRPGGKVIILEFSMPEHFPMKQLYLFYFRRILPLVGGWVSGNRGAYTYLPESVMRFPQGQAFLDILSACGFRNVRRQKLTFGIASLYTGEK